MLASSIWPALAILQPRASGQARFYCIVNVDGIRADQRTFGPIHESLAHESHSVAPTTPPEDCSMSWISLFFSAHHHLTFRLRPPLTFLSLPTVEDDHGMHSMTDDSLRASRSTSKHPSLSVNFFSEEWRDCSSCDEASKMIVFNRRSAVPWAHVLRWVARIWIVFSCPSAPFQCGEG